MDLIYTNANRIDQGVLSVYSFDLSFGDSENNFEMTLGAHEPLLDFNAAIYIEGTEYGGIIDAIKTSTDSQTTTYKGRTWHGILNSKVIQPDTVEDYLFVSGDANNVLAFVIARLGLEGLFVAASTPSGINISAYKFKRYCMAYDGIRQMLADANAKLKIAWEGRAVHLSAVPIEDYTDSPVGIDVATLDLERHVNKVNHLICLGSGSLSERQVIHFYVDQFGRIGDTQYYTGLDEVAEVYDFSNVESFEILHDFGMQRLKDLRNIDSAEMSLNENVLTYDIGDLVGATDERLKISVTANVTQKIVNINNGVISIDYRTGGIRNG